MSDKLVLGAGAEFSTDPRETFLNNNVALIGCTGSGKTLFFIQPQFLNTFRDNLIVYDPKRELIEKYRTMFEERGYRVLELNLADPMASEVTFDPVKYATSSTDISILAQAIVNLAPQSKFSSADRYWEDSACNLAKMGLYYVLAENPDAKFVDVLRFIDRLQVEERNGLMRMSAETQLYYFAENHPDHPMVAPYNSLRVTPIRTAGCIFSTLKNTLSNVFNPDIMEMLENKPTVDVEAFVNNKTILFITSDGKDVYIDAFVNLIFEMLINELTKAADKTPRGVLPIPVHLIMDDFACGTVMKSFPKQISKFRSKGISSTIVLQSESQLTALYNEAASQTILSNNDTLVYLGGNDLPTARTFAQRLGVPLEEVLYMPLDQVLIFRRGQKPIVTKKYPIFDNEEFRRISAEHEARLAQKQRDAFTPLTDNGTSEHSGSLSA